VLPERRAAVESENSTVMTSPALPRRQSAGALWTAVISLFGKVAA
jgi:hypothetical protein